MAGRPSSITAAAAPGICPSGESTYPEARSQRSAPRRRLTRMREDLRWACRYTRRRPILAFTIAATLASAIAAATIAFGLARAILWRELPFRDASRLVFVWED